MGDKPLVITNAKYRTPDMPVGEYVRLFFGKDGEPDSHTGLVFNEKDETIGLWMVRK